MAVRFCFLFVVFPFFLCFLVVFVVVVAAAAAAAAVFVNLIYCSMLARRNCSPAVHLYVFYNCMRSSPISSKSLLMSTQ